MTDNIISILISFVFHHVFEVVVLLVTDCCSIAPRSFVCSPSAKAKITPISFSLLISGF